MGRWTERDIPTQRGRTAIVTGANSGIGFETARALAEKGARVVLACRNLDKANAAAQRIGTSLGSDAAGVDVVKLDLGSLESVREFCAQVRERHEGIDLLVCNAGVMMPPKRRETSDGFELQLGTNHLGHFALVDGLIERVMARRSARVVVVSSAAHRFGAIDFDDLQWERRRFRRFPSYGQSKLANLLFAYELSRRLDRAGADTVVAASHPGWTATNLQRNLLPARVFNKIAMKPPQGALPSLYAATAPGVHSGDYFGPDGFQEMRGFPKKVRSTAASHDRGVAARLWQVSEQLTGATYAALS